jgi:DNA-damage-inducible protein J
MATADTSVRARIRGDIKEEASIVLEAMGLSLSDAIRIMMTRIAMEKELPFEPLIPNKETLAAMRDARRGKVRSFATIKDLMDDLNAPD